jgi:hypothetical protein
MQGSIRVMPGCYITGYAAGRAAAISLREHCSIRKIDVTEII